MIESGNENIADTRPFALSKRFGFEFGRLLFGSAGRLDR